MKTAISVPDDLFNKAEKLARKTGKSRSQIYQEALTEYLLRREPDAVTEAMDQALTDIDQGSDPWFSEAGRRALEKAEW